MDVVPIALTALALLDSALAGYRDAAGRNPLIEKRRYYLRAHVRGLSLGLMAVAVGAGTVAALLATSQDASALYAALLRAGEGMLWVYVPYALAIVAALAIFFAPGFDIKTLTTVIVLGPGTMLRPWFIAAGVVAAAVVEPEPRAVVAAGVAALAVGLVQPMLGLRWRSSGHAARWFDAS